MKDKILKILDKVGERSMFPSEAYPAILDIGVECRKGVAHQRGSYEVVFDSMLNCKHKNLKTFGFDASQCGDCGAAFTKSLTCILLDLKKKGII